MNKFTKLLALSLLLPLNVLAAGHVLNTKITSVYCGYPGSFEMCSVTFDKPIVDKDSCNTLSERMQFKPDTAIGQAMLTLALAAKATKESVDVYSTGACTIQPGLADLNWIEIKS